MLQAHGMVPALLCEVGHVAGGVLAALRSLYSRCKLTGYKFLCGTTPDRFSMLNNTYGECGWHRFPAHCLLFKATGAARLGGEPMAVLAFSVAGAARK
jgi:hypothetical protein